MTHSKANGFPAFFDFFVFVFEFCEFFMRGNAVNNEKGLRKLALTEMPVSSLSSFFFESKFERNSIESHLSEELGACDHQYGISKPMPDDVILERIRRASGISENTKLNMEYMFRKRVSGNTEKSEEKSC